MAAAVGSPDHGGPLVDKSTKVIVLLNSVKQASMRGIPDNHGYQYSRGAFLCYSTSLDVWQGARRGRRM